ncbi:unnamed protein product [Phytophthora fragariaefolia]|uniref:Unnamed protein product n=1 Tax=Phytophthora fragariaefolia TaxID=1490495 RepID=A0A9W7D0W4_9STRA|nr:unnamed protein product [Phytophthora fragariaefolia]
MRFERDENPFQGLVLQASRVRDPQRESELQPPMDPPPQPSPMAETGASSQQQVVAVSRLLSLEDKSSNSVTTRGPTTRSRTRSTWSKEASREDLRGGEAVENSRDSDDDEAKQENPSPFSGPKKPRKRPHYLSHEDRCQIIERIAGGEQQAALAREFGVTRAAVCHIQKHRFEILSRPFIRCRILIEEVLGQLDARAVEVVTTSGFVTSGIEQKNKLCGVKLGDEGYPLSALFHQVEVEAAEGLRSPTQIASLSQRSSSHNYIVLPM